MGSGKSSVGKLLSEKLKIDFIDFDKLIEDKTGKTIIELFETEGEDKFRLLEHAFLNNLPPRKNVVIALGGGTPCFHNNIDLINKTGISVYLEMNADALAKRLSKEKRKRPLLHNMNEQELKLFIEKNLEKRFVFYRKAKYAIQIENHSAEEIANKIMKLTGTAK